MNATTPFKVVGTRPVRPDGADKVTGRAKFGADFALPGMLVGKVLRSPHAHARIRAIRTERALAMPGVKAVVTGADLADIPAEWVGNGRVEVNFRHLTLNVLARDKVLYEGHAVAAVAATTAEIAAAALAAIEVDYAVLPHVIDVSEAMKPDAPLLHEDMITRGVTPAPTKPSNIAKRVEIAAGDVAAGFAEAEVVIERQFTTAAVHQGYIEPTATLAAVAADGECTVWTATQGHFQVRAHCARMLGIDISKVRVIPAEIGGGFGGKLNVYIEPVALALARKSGRPVKIVMGRDEVFKGTGPTSGSAITIKVGAMRDGRIVAGEATFALQAGAFPGSPVMNACMVAFGSYAIPNVRTIGYDVVTNRPKSAAYRAPGAPIAGFAAEGVLDELAERLGMDPIALRQKNIAREGVTTAYGQTFGKIGFAEVLEAARTHPHYAAPLGPNQGRGFACGFWFNGGGESSAALNINEDGTAILITGSPDLSGTRASLAMMAAEELGVPVERIRPVVGDTSSIAYTGISAGSRVTFATGKAVVEASRSVIKELCRRAARIWKVDEEGVEWKDGQARPAGDNVGKFPALSLKEIAGKALAMIFASSEFQRR